MRYAFIGDDEEHWEVEFEGVSASSLDAALSEAQDILKRAEENADLDHHAVVPSYATGPFEPKDESWARISRAQKLADDGERALAVILLQTVIERRIKSLFGQLLEAKHAPELRPAVKRREDLTAPEGRAVFAYLTGVDPAVVNADEWRKYLRHVKRRGASAHGGVEPVSSDYWESYDATTWLLKVVDDAAAAHLK